jgi:electron transport complex protein RnfE
MMSASVENVNKQEVFTDGIWYNNTIFVQLLGMCPLLGVTTTAENGFWMGLATLAVLIGSNFIVSLVRDFIPDEVRIPAYIVIIASLVTIVGLMMNAWMHEMYLILGLFIPLIVVNCSILGRAEAFASKNSVSNALVDALGMGLGFTFALVLLGGVRELLGQGELFGFDVLGASYPDVLVFILPPGAFLALGFILAGVNLVNKRLEQAKENAEKSKVEPSQSEEAAA